MSAPGLGALARILRRGCGRCGVSGIVAVASLVLAAACGAQASVPGELLRGRAPAEDHGVRGAERLTDGRAAVPGDAWQSDLAAVFKDLRSFVVFDLGAVRPIGAAWLQGDGNDAWAIESSVDGKVFQSLWLVPPAQETLGMQERSTQGLHASARYVRLRPQTGDGLYSLAELQLFSDAPAALPASVTRHVGAPDAMGVHDRLVVWAAAIVLFLLVARGAAPWWWNVAMTVWPAWQTWQLASAAQAGWPLAPQDVSLLRAVCAALALAALCRESLAFVRWPAWRPGTAGVLGLSAVLAVAAFYNLGTPQFRDEGQRKATFVHLWDMHQYFAAAKYFPEVGYGKMYQADMAAWGASAGGLDAIATRRFRDLDTHRPVTVAEQRAAIERVPQVFSPERWAAYQKDAAYFREAMGPGYADALLDHGANATPVWMLTARLVFGNRAASSSLFEWTALLDPLLFILLFVVVARTFGWRAACVVMVVFGANDFVMFGTNWAGSTLRHDWLVALGLAACALHARRWTAAGVLLGLATMIRAFPAAALVGLAMPAGWVLLETVAREGRSGWRSPHAWGRWARLLGRELRNARRVWLAALVVMVALFGLSCLLFGVQVWGAWWHKVVLLSAEPHANHISLRTLVAGNNGDQGAVLAARRPVYWLLVGVYATLLVLAARGRPLERAAMLGLPLVVLLSYPANYYLHLVCLLPLVALGARGPLSRGDLGAQAALLLLCVAQYFTVGLGDWALHFYLATVLWFTALAALLVVLARDAPCSALGAREELA